MRNCSLCHSLVSGSQCPGCVCISTCQLRKLAIAIRQGATPAEWRAAVAAAANSRCLQLARLLTISARQLEREFKREVGVSPQHWLREQQLLRAKKQLLKGRWSKEAAGDVRLTPSYLCTVFKKRFGMTPSEFVRSVSAGKCR